MADDFELAELKLDLLTSICYLILTPNHESVLVEGLRVIANLCRNKRVVEHLFSLNYAEALTILLSHTREEVLVNSVGILVNMSADQVR